jgi:hypothetical protein
MIFYWEQRREFPRDIKREPEQALSIVPARVSWKESGNHQGGEK